MTQKQAGTLTYKWGCLRAEGHIISMVMSFGQVGQVGIYIPSTDASYCVVTACAVGLAEDADEVGDPLLVSLPGQQCHDHQLDAQKHEKVAPSGLDTDHGGGSALSKQQTSGGGSAESHVGLEQSECR